MPKNPPAPTRVIDDEETFRRLKERPVVAWPTVWVLLACWTVILASWRLVLDGVIPLWAGCAANCIAYYYLFAPMHDGLHRAIARNTRLNDALTHIAFFALLPMPGAVGWARLHHAQHHVHCGDPKKDPDIEISGNGWNALHRWWVWGSHYLPYYYRRAAELPEPQVTRWRVGACNWLPGYCSSA